MSEASAELVADDPTVRLVRSLAEAARADAAAAHEAWLQARDQLMTYVGRCAPGTTPTPRYRVLARAEREARRSHEAAALIADALDVDYQRAVASAMAVHSAPTGR